MAPQRGADERLAAPFHKFLNDFLLILSVKVLVDNQEFQFCILLSFSEISIERFSQQSAKLVY